MLFAKPAASIAQPASNTRSSGPLFFRPAKGIGQVRQSTPRSPPQPDRSKTFRPPKLFPRDITWIDDLVEKLQEGGQGAG